MLFSITMLFIVGRLLLQFTSIYRPSAYEGLGFHDLYGKPGEYGGTFTSQFLMDIARALNYLLWGMLLGVLIGIGADNTLLKKET